MKNDFNSLLLSPNPDSVTFKYPTFNPYCNQGIPPNSAPNTGYNFLAALGYASAAVNAGAQNFYDSSSSGSQYHAKQTVNFDRTSGTPITGGSVVVASQVYEESGLEYVNRQARFRRAVRRAFFGYADERSDHQLKDPSKPNFMNPYRQHTGKYSTFMLGFDLDTFSNNTDTIRSGHYLGNNTVSLNLSSVEFVDNSPCNQALMTNARMDTYVLHDLRLSFQAGGIVQAFY